MRIFIVGAGAMGCLFSGMLAAAGHRVVIIEKDPQRVSTIRREGIRIERDGLDSATPVREIYTDASRAGIADLVLLLVKAYDTKQAIQSCLPAMGPGTAVLTLQNGLGNIEAIGPDILPEQIFAGTTAQGATLLGHGRVRHAGRGETVIGPLVPSAAAKAEAMKTFFNESGIPTELTDDVQSVLWGKLLVNAGINALTAVMDTSNGSIAQQEQLRDIMSRAVREGVAIAEKLGIRLPYGDPVGRTEEVCRATAANFSSMLQDIRSGRRTEIMNINGQLAAYGDMLGLPAQVNHFLTLLVTALEGPQP